MSSGPGWSRCSRIGPRPGVVVGWITDWSSMGCCGRTRSGSAWRDLPECYGNWKTVYNRHRRWSGDGTWRVVLSSLRTDCDKTDAGEWVVGVDATVIRAHHQAAGARHEPPKDIPAGVLASVVLEAPIRLLKETGGTIELHEFR